MNEELYLAFENYLHNEMSPDERLEFENKLQNDIQMQHQFESYKETTEFLAAKFDSETTLFKSNLEKISKDNFAQPKSESKVINFKPWVYSVAATIVLAVGVWFMIQGNPQYNDYNQHENAYFTERGTSDQNLKQAQDAFNAKEYKKAVASFEKEPTLSSPELQYFYAIALIETNSYAKAERLLNEIKSGTSVYKNKAIWYLALSNLKQKKFDECEIYLNQIPSDAEDYDKAQKLLKDLD